MDNQSTKERINRIVSFIRMFLLVIIVIGYLNPYCSNPILQLCILGCFFIIGFSSNSYNKMSKDIIVKFLRYVIPYIVFLIVCLAGVYIIGRLNKIELILPYQYEGMKLFLKNYIMYTKPCLDIFGPIWILFATFLCVVLHNVILKFNFINKIYINLIVVVLGYFFGIYILMEKGALLTYIGIILIVFAFYETGFIFSKMDFLNYINLWKNKCIAFVSSIVIIFTFAYVLPHCLNISDTALVKESTIYVITICSMSILIILGDAITNKIKLFNKLIDSISKNLLGVLVFLFPVTKLLSYIMLKLQVFSMENVRFIMSLNPIEIKYWWLLVIPSILLCVLLWNLLCCIKPLRYILGQDDTFNNRVYIKLSSLKQSKMLSEKYICIEETIKKTFKSLISDYRRVVLLIAFILFVFVLSIPLLRCGISCNDELQARYWGMHSFVEFYRHYYGEIVKEGRLLAIFSVPLELFIQFAFRNRVWKGIVSLIVIGLDLLFAVKILNKLFNRKALNYIFIVTFVGCLPITFEHTLPNVFVAFLGIPTILFFASILLFMNYCEKKQRRYIVWAMILLFVSMCSYESMITLMPLYVVIVWFYSKDEEKIILGMLKKIAIPFSTSVIYLVLYLVMGKMVETTYDGNMMVFESFGQSATIVKNLMLSALPGYYSFFSPKYKYLYDLYSNGKDISVMGRIFTALSNPGIIIMILALVAILIIVGKSTYKKVGFIKTIIIVVISSILMILPALPYSISKQYQNNVGEMSNIALPSTYIMYMYATFAISFVLCQIITNRNAIVKTIIILTMIFYITSIQNMNNVFTKCHDSNNTRLENIERFLATDFLKNFGDSHIYADDLYEQRNLLFIHDGFWKMYCNVNGVSANIDSIETKNTIANVDMLNNETFVVTSDDLCWILSTKQLNESIYIETDEDIYSVCSYNYQVDNGMYVYSYKLNEDKYEEYNYSEALNQIRIQQQEN